MHGIFYRSDQSGGPGGKDLVFFGRRPLILIKRG